MSTHNQHLLALEMDLLVCLVERGGGGGALVARFRGLQNACVIGVSARAFATSLDCSIPISLSSVSVLLIKGRNKRSEGYRVGLG